MDRDLHAHPFNATRPRRNLIGRSAEAFKPPVLKPNSSVPDRLENRFRRFQGLPTGSAWRDLPVELGQIQGRLLDIGCDAQVYRDLIPGHVTDRGIDTSDAAGRFGYSVPDTKYVGGDDRDVGDGAFATAFCAEVLDIPEPAAFLARAYRCLRPDWGDDCLGYTVTAHRVAAQVPQMDAGEP